MNIECSIALDALSIVYMVVLLFNLTHRHKRELLNHQYCHLAIMVCVFLALDIAYLFLYGSTDLFCRVLLKLVKSLYFIVNTVVVWLWVKYIDCILFDDQYKTKKHRMLYTAVLVTNTVMVAVNFFTGMMFDISSAGTFVVGTTAMWIFTLCNYFSVVLAAIILVQNKKRIKRSDFLPLMIFPLPPLFAEIFQIFFRAYSLICTYAVSLLILFQVSQTKTIYTDELTGLANRRMLNETLQKWFSDPKGSIICGMMIDLDGLKQINDTYGHLCGDNAILTLADIIKGIKRKDMVSARYGGDEFILVWLSNEEEDIRKVEQELLASKTRINRARSEPERIEFSIGRLCCRDKNCLSAEAFIKKMDEKMYQCKNEKKKALLSGKEP